MKKNKSKKYLNIGFDIIAIISLIITIIFCIFVFKLDMIPSKYVALCLTVIGVIYLILFLITVLPKIRIKFKVICCCFFVLLGTVFCFGIKYLNETNNFIDLIDNALSQKEEYQIATIKADIKKFEDLRDKKIGVYLTDTTTNTVKAVDALNKELTVEIVEFDNIIDMFEQLSDGNIDAVIINSSIQNLLNSDLSYMELKLQNIHSIFISIKKVDIVKVVDVTNTPFNIYIAGGDAYGSIDKVTNTDVNMVVTVDPENKKILLTSIPRDYYVNLPSYGSNAYDKLTHAGYYGIQESVLAVENLLDISVNYYVKVNFSTIEGVIDAIGGISVYSDYTFKEQAFSKYTFYKGTNKLNGNQALAFARERKAFIDGDVQRVKNQQKVLEAIIKKVSSSTTIITNYSNILDSVSKSFSTNLDSKSIKRLVKMQLNDMSRWSIESQNLVGSDLYTDNVFSIPNMNLYVMAQDEESVEDAKRKIEVFFK